MKATVPLAFVQYFADKPTLIIEQPAYLKINGSTKEMQKIFLAL